MKQPTRKAERTWWNQGHQVVAGIDEVGRGAWAGPVTAAAVVLPGRCRLKGVRDSKLLTKLQRQHLAKHIKQQALAIGIGWSHHTEVDEAGLTKAVYISATRALRHTGEVGVIILDGNHNYLKDEYLSQAIIKADQSSLCVAAASVVAKVARDNYMELLSRLHPEYGFESNKGYGSKHHLAAIKSTGLCPYHRRRWRPVAQAAGALEMQFMEMIGVR
jgi:ribonuclease HII